MLIAINIFCGALLRRMWGGWCQPNNLVKRIMVPTYTFIVAYITYGYWSPSLVVAAGVLCCFLNVKHGYGITMGKDPKRKLWLCLLVMFLQYGCSTLILFTIMKLKFDLLYLPLGTLVPVVYLLANKFWEDTWHFGEYPKGNVFIDGSGAIAELFLGALLMASIV
ncbi:MAG: hypothetical protein EOM35_02250 [Negativicutes bacterium]|nr:hypothetical protein [Negativicutes bacterium]